MRTWISVVTLAGAAVLGALPGTASSATTARTWTVRPGGAITAAKVASVTMALRDTTTGSEVTCQTSQMSGTLTAGSGLAGPGAGQITANSNACRGGPLFNTALDPRGLPWRVSLVSYNKSTGVVHGTISHVKLVFSIAEAQCGATVSGTSGSTANGTVAVSYADKTGVLTILPSGGNLHWYDVQGCAGLVNDGDLATLSASYTVSPVQAITSP